MRSLFCFLFLSFQVSLPAAETPTVTALLSFDKPYSDVSLSAMRQELNTLLADSGVQINVLMRDQFSRREVGGELALFSMKGACNMEPLPIDALIDERGPLAVTYSSDGQLLPFGAVDCDHVRLSLQRVFGRNRKAAHEAELGVALARVMAHEIYHMVANSAVHTKSGVTKESLSAHELLAGGFGLPEQAREAVHDGVVHDKLH